MSRPASSFGGYPRGDSLTRGPHPWSHARCRVTRPPAWVEKRAAPADESPGAQVMALVKRLAPDDPMGHGVTLVQQQDPALWARYQQDYA